MESIEEYRIKILKDLMKTKTMSTAWALWAPTVNSLTESLTNTDKVFDLGDHLSKIFLSTSTEGRGQDVLSAAGHAWEGLVTLYLNMVLSGTNGVAMKQKKSLVPQCILDSTSINYHSDPTNTESDVVVVIFPDGFQFPEGGYTIQTMSAAISPILNRFELGVVQCKTNWNDNSQIPMLWDLVYRSKGFEGNHISVGQNGHYFADLKKFTYAFVTVPTQKAPFKPTDMAVKRVRNLSGGNYWGRETEKGIAFGVKQIFSANFRSAFAGKSIRNSLSDAIFAKAGAFSSDLALDKA